MLPATIFESYWTQHRTDRSPGVSHLAALPAYTYLVIARLRFSLKSKPLDLSLVLESLGTVR